MRSEDQLETASCAARRSSTRTGVRRDAFTLIEMMLVIVVIAILSGVSVYLMGDTLRGARARSSVRSVADLMMLARAEAIRTGDNHIVFFSQDAQDNALSAPGGDPAAALVIRDLDADGIVDSGERVAAIRVDTTNSLNWGSAKAAVSSTQAPEDNPGASFPESDADFLCCTFLEPDSDPARWVVFQPDGLPRAFSVTPFVVGDVGTGNGAVYVTTGERDHAVVLAPLGGARVHSFNTGAGSWTQ